MQTFLRRAVKLRYFSVCGSALFFAVPAGYFSHAAKLIDDISIVFAPVRNGTIGAVFDAIVSICKRTAAMLTQRIERTVAEKTVEILGCNLIMAGETFAVAVTEKGIVFVLPLRCAMICHWLHSFALT